MEVLKMIKHIISIAFVAMFIALASAPLFSEEKSVAQPIGAPNPKLRAKVPNKKDCYYGGARYSEGSVIKGADGVLVQCVGNKWVLK
jgi:hypothetical protein